MGVSSLLSAGCLLPPGRQVPGSVVTQLHVVALAEPGKVGDKAGQWGDIHRTLIKLVLYYQYHDRSDCTL